jgi:hypothetical protein
VTYARGSGCARSASDSRYLRGISSCGGYGSWLQCRFLGASQIHLSNCHSVASLLNCFAAPKECIIINEQYRRCHKAVHNS